jgi:hypothetical protein
MAKRDRESNIEGQPELNTPSYFISRQKAAYKIGKEFKKRAKGRKVVIAIGSGGFSST